MTNSYIANRKCRYPLHVEIMMLIIIYHQPSVTIYHEPSLTSVHHLLPLTRQDGRLSQRSEAHQNCAIGSSKLHVRSVNESSVLLVIVVGDSMCFFWLKYAWLICLIMSNNVYCLHPDPEICGVQWSENSSRSFHSLNATTKGATGESLGLHCQRGSMTWCESMPHASWHFVTNLKHDFRFGVWGCLRLAAGIWPTAIDNIENRLACQVFHSDLT